MKTKFYLHELPEDIKQLLKQNPELHSLVNDPNYQNILFDFSNDRNTLNKIYQSLSKSGLSEKMQDSVKEQLKQNKVELNPLLKLVAPFLEEVFLKQNIKSDPLNEQKTESNEEKMTSVNNGSQELKEDAFEIDKELNSINTSLNSATILAEKGYMIAEDQKGKGVCIIVPIIKGSKISTQSGEGEIAILIESPIVSHNALLSSLIDVNLNYINRISISEDILKKVDFSRSVGEKSDDLFVYYIPYIKTNTIDRQIF